MCITHIFSHIYIYFLSNCIFCMFNSCVIISCVYFYFIFERPKVKIFLIYFFYFLHIIFCYILCCIQYVLICQTVKRILFIIYNSIEIEMWRVILLPTFVTIKFCFSACFVYSLIQLFNNFFSFILFH